MPDAIPTPFDIAAIPYMAWIPGSSTWATALVIVGLIILGAYISQGRRPTQQKQGRLLKSLLRDLQALSDDHGPLYQERALRLATRIVCTLEGQSWSALSPDELKRRCSGYADGPEKQIISCLAELHETLCRPDVERRISSIDALIRQIVEALRSIIKEKRRT